MRSLDLTFRNYIKLSIIILLSFLLYIINGRIRFILCISFTIVHVGSLDVDLSRYLFIFNNDGVW